MVILKKLELLEIGILERSLMINHMEYRWWRIKEGLHGSLESNRQGYEEVYLIL